ncbi:MAG: hypothetical protein WCF68_15150 [Terriglobales bacterium]
MRRWLACCVQLLLVASLSFSQDVASLARHVSQRLPVASPRTELSAQRLEAQPPAIAQPDTTNGTDTSHTWQLLATLPAAIIHDISFPTALVGYAVGEHGQVWKTTDGGTNWQQVLSAGENYYFYGVDALSAKEVVISGFYDSSTTYSVFRWSHDGGSTWTSDLSFGATPLQRVRFANAKDGIIMEQGGGNSPTVAEFTTSGGATLSAWADAVDNPSGAWFDPQFSLLANRHARASGINFCTSVGGGSQWTCGNSVDSVFDGPVFFLNDKKGWVGGGEISPNVEGWLHLTTNGGNTWTGRVFDGPWPIRSILFLNSKTGWATGGNFWTGVGGIYFSSNGGTTWSVDATTNAEMGACAQHAVTGGHQIWCAGFIGNPENYSSVVYSTQY